MTELFASRKQVQLAPMFPAQGPPLVHMVALEWMQASTRAHAEDWISRLIVQSRTQTSLLTLCHTQVKLNY